MFFEYIKAIIYGIIEGVTEWLPISSTGHLILLERIIPLNVVTELGTEFSEQYLTMFDVVIQVGAILAVLCLYFKKLFPFKHDTLQRKSVLSLWGKLILATVPAAIIGLAADKACESFLGRSLDSILFKPQIVASALIVYGLLFILVERLTRNTEYNMTDSVSWRSALAIGFFQTLAIIPGTSRSGATILGARILGIRRSESAEFSFFAAIPIISAASLLKTVDFVKYARVANVSIPFDAIAVLILACAVAFAISLLAIKFLTDFVKRHSFLAFGIYRIILGILVLFFVK